MIPSTWVGVILALGAYRLDRLIGWDDFPLILKLRAWATGCEQVRGEWVQGEHYTYQRPMLHKLITCPFCGGAWVAFFTYAAWLWLPTPTLYVMAPLALAAAVGLIAKNLDP